MFVYLGGVFIRNRLGSGPLIHVKHIQCYLQDVVLAMIPFCKRICEGGTAKWKISFGKAPCVMQPCPQGLYLPALSHEIDICIAESSAAITSVILIDIYNLWKCRIGALLKRSVSNLSLATRCCQATGNGGKVRGIRHVNFEPILPKIICVSLSMLQACSLPLRSTQ